MGIVHLLCSHCNIQMKNRIIININEQTALNDSVMLLISAMPEIMQWSCVVKCRQDLEKGCKIMPKGALSSSRFFLFRNVYVQNVLF